ncbi:MAG: PASTA domain-containing protein [Flavobacteriales bacterium]
MSFRTYIKSPEFRKTLLRVTLVYLGFMALIWFFLNWYTDHGEFITVPELKGMKLEEAIKALDERDLDHLVIDSIYDKKAVPGSIMDQSPVAESQVKDGRQVFLTIYSFSPPLERLGVKEGDFAQVAIIKLNNKGIEYDTLYEDNNTYAGSIIKVTYKGRRTSPEDLIPKGDKVKLVIGRAVRTKSTVPDLHGLTCKDAEILLESLNFKCNCLFSPGINLPTAQDSATYHVCRQNPEHDPLFGASPGSVVDLWLYNTPCPVDTTNQNIDY